VARIASQFWLGLSEVLAPGKYPQTVKTGNVLCFLGHARTGDDTVELSKRLKLSQSSISQSAKRDQKIAQGLGLCLIEKGKQ
jgi:hypothetical protein